MVTREEVLSELNELVHDSPVRVPAEVMDVLRHALEYIEPRILTLDEAFDSDVVFYESRSVYESGSGYGEIFGSDAGCGVKVERIGKSGFAFEDERDYGSAWRCWNTRPTEEQRKSEQWKEYRE